MDIFDIIFPILSNHDLYTHYESVRYCVCVVLHLCLPLLVSRK